MSDQSTSPNRTPLPLHAISEDDRAHLVGLLDSLKTFGDLICEHSTPYDGTEFASDAVLLTVTSTWESAAIAGQNALDHLFYFTSSTIETGRLTAFASFTLIRSAITASALVMWLLPENRTERLTRALNLAWQEASNERSAAHEYLVAVPIGAAPHLKARVQDAKRVVAKNDVILEQIRRDAERNGIEVGAVKRKPKDQDVIKIASRSIHPAPQYNEFGPEKEALATWRFLSAHAHGQGWAANTTSQTVADPDGGTPRTMWNPDIEMAMQGVRIAWDLLYAAFAQYDQLGRVVTPVQHGR